VGGRDYVPVNCTPNRATAPHLELRLFFLVPPRAAVQPVLQLRRVAAQVDAFEKAKFETGFSHFVGRLQGLKPGRRFQAIAMWVAKKLRPPGVDPGSSAFSTCTAPPSSPPRASRLRSRAHCLPSPPPPYRPRCSAAS
jgi:hypothetical protein